MTIAHHFKYSELSWGLMWGKVGQKAWVPGSWSSVMRTENSPYSGASQGGGDPSQRWLVLKESRAGTPKDGANGCYRNIIINYNPSTTCYHGIFSLLLSKASVYIYCLLFFFSLGPCVEIISFCTWNNGGSENSIDLPRVSSLCGLEFEVPRLWTCSMVHGLHL